jgi:hypothetical protein
MSTVDNFAAAIKLIGSVLKDSKKQSRVLNRLRDVKDIR